jgi:diguanylate cyclase (GGDEF)-like protein
MRDATILVIQAVTYFCALSLPFYYRKRIGVGVFLCALGVLHFLETYLAAVFFIQLPIGMITPGSTVLFTGKLAMFLLLYIKEDAETVRQPIYGLLIGNVLVVVLALTLRLYDNIAVLPGYNPDFRFVDQMGLLMIWGTILLFVDIVLLIVLYEKLGRWIAEAFWPRFFISLVIVLSIDQVFFFFGLHLLSGIPLSALFGGWVAKLAMAAVYATLIATYLRVAEPTHSAPSSLPISDVFDRLTYRHRYENLLRNVGRDSLTGLNNRGQLDIIGPTMMALSKRSANPLSLMMIDIDHFKSINDTRGHATGDRVIKTVSEVIAATKREADAAFRYGGDEFVILCAGDNRAAMKLAERITSQLTQGGLEQATLSIGIATYPSHASDLASLLESADGALYQAKRSSRNTTCLAGALESVRSGSLAPNS